MSEFTFQTYAKFQGDTQTRIHLALGAVSHLLFVDIPPYIRESLSIRKHPENQSVLSIEMFDWDLEYHDVGNVVGMNAGYTLTQLNHTFELLELIQTKLQEGYHSLSFMNKRYRMHQNDHIIWAKDVIHSAICGLESRGN